MAVYCDTCLGDVCDYCRWYDFNGDEDGCYTGDGWCRLHGRHSDPEDGCSEFHCRRVKDGNGTPTPERGLAKIAGLRRNQGNT